MRNRCRALIAAFVSTLGTFVAVDDGNAQSSPAANRELTRLSQFTFEPNGTRGNRATQDSFGLKLLDDLNSDVGPLLPDGLGLFVGLTMPVANVSQFRTALTAWASEVAAAAAEGMHQEREIEGSPASISVFRHSPSGHRIAGFVFNSRSSADIGLNARLLLQDRICAKNKICAALPEPLWLALLNDYWLADN